MFKKQDLEEVKWDNGFLTEAERIAPSNLPMLKHAYEAVLLNYKDLQQSYTLQQNRIIETCKWLTGFYLAFILALKPITINHELWYNLIPLIGVPIIIGCIFYKYLAQAQYPIGNNPSGLLYKGVINEQEGDYYFTITAGYEERIVHLRNTLTAMTEYYQTCIISLFILLGGYSACLGFASSKDFLSKEGLLGLTIGILGGNG
jgi:hypothetical protein